MPHAKTHKVIGTGTGIVVAMAYSYIENDSENAWQYAIGGGLGGYAFSRVADIMEPSEILGPNHRGGFHGVIVNGSLAVLSLNKVKTILNRLVAKAVEFDNRNEKIKSFLCRCAAGAIIGGIAGHFSHLIADLQTPTGLPLLC